MNEQVTIRVIHEHESATVWVLKAPFRLTWWLIKWTLVVLVWTTVVVLVWTI